MHSSTWAEDVLSLLAPHSLFDNTQLSKGGTQWEEPHSDSTEVDEESAVKEDFPVNTLVIRVLMQQRLFVCSLLCLIQLLLGVPWKAYLRLILLLAFQWQIIIPQCWGQHCRNHLRSLNSMQAVHGWPMPVSQQKLGDMPPVEQAIASWTALRLACASANPRCPRKECAKTDHLISQSFNTAACAGRGRLWLSW